MCGSVRSVADTLVGYIFSPLIEYNGLYYYESSLNCTWTIAVGSSNVLLSILITDIEESPSCTRDYLKVCITELGFKDHHFGAKFIHCFERVTQLA